MANLTISLDDALIKRARVRAIEQGTSLSAKVREFLQGFVDESPAGIAQQRAQATARLMAAIGAASVQARSAAGSARAAPAPRRTLREEIYEGDFRAAHRPTAAAGGRKRSR